MCWFSRGCCRHFAPSMSNKLDTGTQLKTVITMKSTINYSAQRAACDRFESTSQPMDIVQPIAHCAMHCTNRLSHLSPQQTLRASKGEGNILTYCISGGRRLKAEDCSRQASVHKLLISHGVTANCKSHS